MRRDVEYARVVGKRVVGAVAVVNVKVKDGDAGEAVRGLGMPRRDRRGVEDAEPHGVGGDGVVAGGAHQRKRRVRAALLYACAPRMWPGGRGGGG